MTLNKRTDFGRKRLLLSNKTICCISILLCLCSAGGDGTNYSEIVRLGSSCAALDSCAHPRATSRRQRSHVKNPNCNCDPSCSEYGDCCVDALPTSRGGRNDLTCLHVEQSGGVYMKDSCPPSFAGPVKDLCEGSKLGDQADPLAAIPITDPLSGLTYKNFYCNLCNGNANDVVMWTPKLDCPLLRLLNKSSSITPTYVLEKLATDGRSWGLYLTDESDGEVFFHECKVYPVMPTRLQRTVRPCVAGLVADCPPTHGNGEVARTCRSYAGARFDADGRGYRNVHCAACNGVAPSRLSCEPLEEVDIFRDFGTHSFALLLDVSEATGSQVGRVRRCRRGEVFDPFFRKCRGVSCLPGFVRRGRRCAMRSQSEFIKFYAGRRATTSTTWSYRDAVNATFDPPTFRSTPGYTNATLPNT